MKVSVAHVKQNPEVFEISDHGVFEKTVAAIAAGRLVTLLPTSGDETDAVKAMSNSPELQRKFDAYLKAGIAKLGEIEVDKEVRNEWKLPATITGGATGAVAGASIGVLLDTLGTVHPKSATAFKWACALIGASVGASGLRIKGFGFEIAPGK
jgi:hypothetical protein